MDLNIKNTASPTGIITTSLGLACQKPFLDTPRDNLLKAVDETHYKAK